MIDATVTGIVANVITEGGRRVLQTIFNDNSLYAKVEKAYYEALKSWTKNSHIRESESVWTRSRFQALIEIVLDPKKESLLDSNILKLLQIFEVELQRDTLLWNHIQSRVFKQSISALNNIAENIDILLAEIEANKIDAIELMARLSSNVEFQIQRNINSKKYIPDTFLEVDEMKENARYFCVPYQFYNKVFREVSNFNFDYLNTYLRSVGESMFAIQTSDYDVSSFDGFPILYEKSRNLENYLKSQCAVLENGHYKRYASRYKLNDKARDLNHFYSRLLLLTANAGQGKTNFLCDLSENIILKRGIPCIFLNGYEIQADNVGESIARRVYPINSNYSLFDIIGAISDYCENNKCTFLLIIDGLNENSSPENFSRNLLALMRELMKFDFVKIILSCRTEYFEHNFREIKTSFSQYLSTINFRNGDLTDTQKERLLDNYLSYFKIKVSLSSSVKDQLIENFLLLRIFSEAYEGQSISHISDLYKDEIFYKYYDKMSKSVAQRIKENGVGNMTPLLIKQFLTSIVEHMIESHQFNNVPLDK
ncbi:MAG: hypothetical protein LUD76_10545, partial [Alistipes sp.]|nr:hypothetical protein [Alistipes sp.]